LRRTGIDNDAAPSVFHRLLCDLGGWAGLGRYRLWEAEQAQTRDTTFAELLAIRLTWEQALHTRYAEDVGPQWDALVLKHRAAAGGDEAFNRRCLAKSSRTGVGPPPRHIASASERAADPLNLYHAKRSLYSAWTSFERLRRALEIIEPEIQTYGTAGFSNLPLVNQPSM
jgi:uncharacterized protein YbcC (UPF0753/DUF2309 family)